MDGVLYPLVLVLSRSGAGTSSLSLSVRHMFGVEYHYWARQDLERGLLDGQRADTGFAFGLIERCGEVTGRYGLKGRQHGR